MDPLDIVERKLIIRQVIELRGAVDSCPAIFAAVSSSPPFRRYSVMPVPRRVWLQISAG